MKLASDISIAALREVEVVTTSLPLSQGKKVWSKTSIQVVIMVLTEILPGLLLKNMTDDDEVSKPTGKKSPRNGKTMENNFWWAPNSLKIGIERHNWATYSCRIEDVINLELQIYAQPIWEMWKKKVL